jgi:hypothetical protein
MKQFLLLVFAFGLLSPAMAQRARKSPHDTLSAHQITITYGRPYKKDRVVFGTLEPYNQVWRVGADEATEIKFDRDVKFNGQPVKAGTYSLFAIPTPKSWTIILNPELKQWGAYGYEKIKSKNVLETVVPTKNLSNVVEQLTIEIEKKGISIAWDKTGVFIPVK